jgi:short-subunit dehydrogenase
MSVAAVAIVTGATRGIGLALTEALLRDGMTVYAIGLDDKRLADVAARLASPRLHMRRLDVADGNAFAALVADVVAAQGRLDWMVNNAGCLAGGELADMSEAQLRQLVDVNLWGVIHGSRLASIQMRKQRGGRIINLASMAGVLPVPFSAVYTATKYAVFGFSLALREELRGYGVGVHVVCPDVVATEIFDRAGNTHDYSYRRVIDRHMGRAISAADAARHVVSGVRKEQPIIYAPPRSRVLGAVGRIFPSLVARQVAARMGPDSRGNSGRNSGGTHD